MVRSQTIYNWKKYGLIHDDYNALYETYINTTHCNHCKKMFKNSRDRCMDHDHETGMFRSIVCNACNLNDAYIKYPNGFDKKEYKKKYNEKNRERFKEHYKEYKKKWWEQNKAELSQIRNQKYTCSCGSITSMVGKSQHNKTLKHMDWWINSLD